MSEKLKAFWCWLNGHKWQGITDPAEVNAEIELWLKTGSRLPRMCKCSRCGFKK